MDNPAAAAVVAEATDIRLPGESLVGALNDLRAGMTRVETKLDSKAEKADVTNAISGLEGRVTTLEQRDHDRQIAAAAVSAHKETAGLSRRQKFGILGAVVGGATGVALAISAYIVH